MSEWQPIETAPLDKWLLLWWTPVGGKHAEAPIIGQVSSHEADKYWDGDYPSTEYRGGYKDLARVTHWMPLPSAPNS